MPNAAAYYQCAGNIYQTKIKYHLKENGMKTTCPTRYKKTNQILQYKSNNKHTEGENKSMIDRWREIRKRT